MDCYCDGEMPVWSDISKPKAKKQYRCEECNCHIQPGEQYERVVGVWGGNFERFCICVRCHDLRQWVQNNVPCFCWAYGNLFEDAERAIDDAVYRAPAETVGLRFGFLRRKKMILKHKAAQALTLRADA